MACLQAIFDICKMSALEAEMDNFLAFPLFENNGEKQVQETIKNVKLRVFFVFWYVWQSTYSILYNICYEDCSLL